MSNTEKGNRYTPKGLMPPDLAKRHKLVGVVSSDAWSGSRSRMKRSVQSTNTYRLLVHGVLEKKLASSLVANCRYFLSTAYSPRKDDSPAPVVEVAK